MSGNMDMDWDNFKSTARLTEKDLINLSNLALKLGFYDVAEEISRFMKRIEEILMDSGVHW